MQVFTKIITPPLHKTNKLKLDSKIGTNRWMDGKTLEL